jgi:hypothetical protein
MTLSTDRGALHDGGVPLPFVGRGLAIAGREPSEPVSGGRAFVFAPRRPALLRPSYEPERSRGY